MTSVSSLGAIAHREHYAGQAQLPAALNGSTYGCTPNFTGRTLSEADSGSAITRVPQKLAGTIKNASLRVNGVVAATTTVTVAICVNGTPVMTATYADTDATGTLKTFTPTTASIAAGDNVVIQLSHDNGSTRNINASWCYDIEPTS